MKRHRESPGTTLESWDIITNKTVSTPEGVFECKTCNRKFSSLQALGGQKASHKRVKLEEKEQNLKPGTRGEPKRLKCFICGKGFSLSKALGGHMRRHSAATNELFSPINQVVAKVSVLKRSSNAKVLCLDLNLTPLQNELNLLLFGKVSPKANRSSF